MIYGSLCSGIEAATAAWHPLGWEAAFFSEIEPFPSTVLAHHYPDVPNLGDMTKFKEWENYDIDVLVGGTPCQSFSVAGLRKGLADPRGNLMLTYAAIACKYRPRWLVWENVPGVLSSDEGRDFASFLGLITGQRVEVPKSGWGNAGVLPGYRNAYGAAYRVIDAQYVRVESHARAVPQRRRRVFVVGHLGDWRRAAAVLFERESLCGHSPPSRKAGQDIAGTLSSRTSAGGGLGTDFELAGGIQQIAYGGNNQSGEIEVSTALNAKSTQRQDFETETFIAQVAPCLDANYGRLYGQDDQHISSGAGLFVAHSLRAEGFDASEDGTGRGTPLVPVHPYTLAIRGRGDSYQLEYRQDGTANAVLTPNGGRAGIGVGAIAFDCKASGQSGFGIGDVASTQRAMGHANSHTNGGGHQAVMHGMQVRRLTPRECERLQGFADDFTLVPFGKPSKAKLDADFLKYQLRGNPKHLSRGDIDCLAADGPRYKALGNSMAVNVMRYIGERIQSVEEISA